MPNQTSSLLPQEQHLTKEPLLTNIFLPNFKVILQRNRNYLNAKRSKRKNWGKDTYAICKLLSFVKGAPRIISFLSNPKVSMLVQSQKSQKEHRSGSLLRSYILVSHWEKTAGQHTRPYSGPDSNCLSLSPYSLCKRFNSLFLISRLYCKYQLIIQFKT